MTKKANLNTIANSTNSISAINAELERVNEQFENTVSRDGSTPNHMEADLDLDSNDLLNVGKIDATDIFISGSSVAESILESQLAAAVSATAGAISAAEALVSANNAVLSASAAAASALDAISALDAAGSATSAAAMPYMNVAGLGVLPTNSGAANNTAFDSAMNVAVSLGMALVFDAGTYEFERKPIIPSNTVLIDPTYGNAVLKLSDTAHDDESLLCGPMHGDTVTALVENVKVFGFTLDGNHARSPNIGTARPGGTCAGSGYVKDWLFYRTAAHGAKLHGFDASCFGEHDGTHRVYSVGGNTHPSTGRANGVRFIECRAWNCGDDEITTHFCDDVTIKDGTFSHASGRHPSLGAPNMIEIDDGSFNVLVSGNTVLGPAVNGIVAKCHDNYPAAENVTIVNNRISGCARGIYVNDPNSGGASPSAKGVTINGNVIFDLSFFDDPTDGEQSDTSIYGIAVGEYTDVIVTNNRIVGNGLYEVEVGLNGGSSDRQTESAIDFSSGAKFICTGNSIYNWASNNTTDTTVAGIRPSNSCTGIVSGNMIRNCGYRGIVDTGGNTGSIITNNLLILDSALAGSVALRVSNQPDNIPTTLFGNQALGAWETALSVDSEDYETMQDAMAAGNIKSAFSASRGTDIVMNTATTHVITTYAQDHDLLGDFISATGEFTCRNAGLHYFHGEVVFSEGDGSDDTAAIGFYLNDTSFIRNHSINPRSISGAGKETTETVVAEIMLERGDTISLRLEGMSATTPVIARNFRFYGGAK